MPRQSGGKERLMKTPEIQAHLQPAEIATHLRAMGLGDRMVFCGHTIMSLINSWNDNSGARRTERVYFVIDNTNLDEQPRVLSFEEAFQFMCTLSAKKVVGEDVWEEWTK